MSSQAADYPTLHPDLEVAARDLRESVVNVLAEVGAAEMRPTDLTRRFGLDKSLAWKLCQVTRATESAAILELIPGASAMEIFARAMEQSRASEPVVARLREAHGAFVSAVERHAGDRGTLELLVDALGGKRRGRLETSRRLAFRGNSGIWGVQARVRTNTVVLSPNADDPEMVDSTLVGGWVDFRRLRAEARWALFRRHSFGPEGVQSARREVALDPAVRESPDPAVRDLMLLPSHCRGQIPQIIPQHEGTGVCYELGPSPVGNTGAFTCFFGSVVRQIGPRTATREGEQAEFFARISAPVETLVFDLFVHRGLGLTRPPTPAVMAGLWMEPNELSDRDVLPMDEPVVALRGGTLSADTPLVPQYGVLLADVVEELGYAGADFLAYRYVLDYPPFPSTVALRLPLRAKG